MSRTCQALKVSKWRLKFQPERKQNNVIFKSKFWLDFQWILGDVESSVAANFCITTLLPLSLALVLFRYNNQSGPQLLCGSALHLAPKGFCRNNIGEPKRKVIVKGTAIPRPTCLCLPRASGLGTPTTTDVVHKRTTGVAYGRTTTDVTLGPIKTRGGNRLHSQLPSECDYLQSTRVYGAY